MEYIIDAKGKRLGRLASEIAVILQGKRSPTYEPRLPGGDRVVLKNYGEFTVSGDKMKSKRYHRHTGYMGHLKTLTLEERYRRDPRHVIRETVRKMLPKNFLNQRRLKNLIFAE